MEINDFQQYIYNVYLKVLAKNSNRAYRNRKNFDKLNEKTKTILKRLEHFFNEHKEISIEKFFQSGFIFLHETFIPIDFFITYKAIVGYRKTQTEQK